VLPVQAGGAGRKVVARDAESDSDSDSDGSDSSSSSSSGPEVAPMARPVFVSKSARLTVKDEAQLAAEEAEEAARAAAAEQERVSSSKQLLAERVAEAKSAAAAALVQKKEVVPIAVDDVDETQEYELWKVRELSRMKRDRDERQMWAKQKEEVERRRLMDDDEILAEDGVKAKSEKTMKFLQRYYHKGAFYQEELKEQYGDEDFSAATGIDADIADKSVLPAVMQVRGKWGLRGRTKYTHLTDQDTTFAGEQKRQKKE
jgi:microfibrillar-associated protein 1